MPPENPFTSNFTPDIPQSINLKLAIMDKNLALFNQINSLSYWLLKESNYKSSVSLDATDDSYFISIKNGMESIYKHHIEDFSKKDGKLLNFELSSIVHHLLNIKRSITDQQRLAG